MATLTDLIGKAVDLIEPCEYCGGARVVPDYPAIVGAGIERAMELATAECPACHGSGVDFSI